MNTPDIATPKGFLFAAVEAAIKKPGRKDLALILSERQAKAAGVFTTNRVKAAPVRLGIERIRSGKGQAIIVNSGNANACNGKQGMIDSLETSRIVAGALDIPEDSVYPCSTGVIGKPLPMERIRPRITELVAGLGLSSVHDVASAIMTTDTFQKLASRQVRINNRTVTITGVCKGAGMICPNMATMLCFLMTDAEVALPALRQALHAAIRVSFNRITVDGDRSTNDTVLIMANGLAGNSRITAATPSFKTFAAALASVADELSRKIVRDGEGATKLVEVEVLNARSGREAKKAAYAIANSPLVKTALYGNDANWGRVMAALGYSGVNMEEGKTDISFGRVRIVRKGISTGLDDSATDEIRQKEVKITVNLRMGKASSEVVTCDLTEEYIKINAEYRT